MSELPQIEPAAVIQRQAEKLAELTTQVAHMELMCEALRSERDEARTQLGTE